MLVLASASPRRQELLRNAGIAFTVQPADIAEVALAGELPKNFSERMAREKVLAVLPRRPEAFVLGADTVVFVEGQILGKPRDAGDAFRMLRLLSGRSHQVITGVCLAGRRASFTGGSSSTSAAEAALSARLLPQRSKRCATQSQNLSASSEAEPFDDARENIFADVRSETTLVVVGELTDDDIRSYIASGEPMDKAGAYAIQGIASRWISRIEGDYFNVVGLPVSLVFRMLDEHGYPDEKIRTF
jgi:septum formation protein